jgi:hypothetical protein
VVLVLAGAVGCSDCGDPAPQITICYISVSQFVRTFKKIAELKQRVMTEEVEDEIDELRHFYKIETGYSCPI